MKNCKTLISISSILSYAVLLELVVMGIAAFNHFVLGTPLRGLGNFFFILGIVILFVAGLSVGGVRRNFGILPLFLPLQKILTQWDYDGMDGTARILIQNAFSLYVGLAGLATFLLGILINVSYPG